MEVAHGQLAQTAIHRLAITAAGEVGFGDSPPATAHFEERNHVIGILICFQIKNKRRKSQNPQRGRGKDCAFEARSCAIAQNEPR